MTVESVRTERSSVPLLVLGALGVVYGDIGTSPLYAFKESLHAAAPAGGDPSLVVYGVLSLLFWTVVLVVSLKYVAFMMSADNKGEGGILAAMAMALQHGTPHGSTRQTIIVAAAVVGAALFYGDATITPAISVLSAVEGLEILTPQLGEIVVPAALVILIGLFAVQYRGTSFIGRFAGPIMALYFLSIAIIGGFHIAQNPHVIFAFSPAHAASFVIANPGIGFLTMGSVFLAVTGAEAIYADMGHFGADPIRIGWIFLVFPALMINYFGQGALVLANPAAAENPFYLMMPQWALLPMILLATAATVIASQAVISGAFSLTRQAIQLGLVPRMKVLHTSASEQGQIYMPAVNWMLAAAVAWLVLGFKDSTALANAYGIAVAGTMIATTIIAFFVMRDVWRWPTWRAALVTAFFGVVDVAFFSANLLKFTHGGWLPFALGLGLAIVIVTWRQGRSILMAIRGKDSVPLDGFIENLTAGSVHRVAGTAVYMTPTPDGVPNALLHNLKHNRVLHERVVLLTVQTEDVPRIFDDERISVEPLAKRFWRVTLRYGFMEKPDVSHALAQTGAQGLPIDMMQTSFFLGRENLVPSIHPRMALWRETLFIALNKLSQSAPDFYRIPADRVIEVGTKVEI